MDYVHIIMAWVVCVFLIASYFIAKVCVSQSRMSDDVDFINAFLHKKEDMISKNNINMKISTYMMFMIITPICFAVTTYILSKSAVFTVLIATASFLTPEGIILIMKQRANKEFENRYARSLEQLASSLKAGLTIYQSVQEVADNKFVHESMRMKYQKLSSDLQMGISVSEAFKHFAEGTMSQDAKDVALAIDIQNEVGGHEAEVILSIAKEIHDHIMLRREVKSLFSGTSSMVYIMDFLPLLIFLFLCISDVNYIAFYFSDALHIGILMAIVSFCVIGSIINHTKLSNIMKGV